MNVLEILWTLLTLVGNVLVAVVCLLLLCGVLEIRRTNKGGAK